MKNSAVFGLGLIAGVALLGALNWTHPFAAGRKSTESTTGDHVTAERKDSQTSSVDAELRARVQQLSLEVAALRREVPTAPVVQAPAPEATPLPPSSESDAESKAQADEQRRERIAEVEAGFRSEPHDPKWSRPMEAGIQDAVNNVKLSQSTLRSVRCQSKTCRVELSVQDPAQLSREMPALISALSENIHGSAMDFVEDPRGGQTGTLYLFR